MNFLVAIKLLKPKQPAIQLPPDTDTDHLPPVLPPKEHHSPSFDLNIARVSLIVEVISFAFVGLSNTPVAFTLFTMLGSFGVGFSPGVHSVALYLYTRRGEKDNGRLFGALSVVQGLWSVNFLVFKLLFFLHILNTWMLQPHLAPRSLAPPCSDSHSSELSGSSLLLSSFCHRRQSLFLSFC